VDPEEDQEERVADDGSARHSEDMEERLQPRGPLASELRSDPSASHGHCELDYVQCTASASASAPASASASAPTPASAGSLHKRSSEQIVSRREALTAHKARREPSPDQPHGMLHCKECAICLEHYRRHQLICGLPCGHSYHEGCIMPWLYRDNHCCPKCRWPPYKQKPKIC
jgi:hypothetical protein